MCAIFSLFQLKCVSIFFLNQCCFYFSETVPIHEFDAEELFFVSLQVFSLTPFWWCEPVCTKAHSFSNVVRCGASISWCVFVFCGCAKGFQECMYVLFPLIFSSFLFPLCRRHIYLVDSPLCRHLFYSSGKVFVFCQGLVVLPCCFEAVFLLLVVFSLHIIVKVLVLWVCTEGRCSDSFSSKIAFVVFTVERLNLSAWCEQFWLLWNMLTQRDSHFAFCSCLCLFTYDRVNIFNTTSCIFYCIV